MGSKGRPYRTVVILGFEVLIGRGDQDNDMLTFRIGEPQDIWLHVGGGTPGSHVIVRNPEKCDVPRDVIERAAAAAAWYSKARGAAKVDVHVCRVVDVSKPRGAPAGLVALGRHRTFKVRPAAPTGSDE